MKVSIIVPIYNVEKYLSACIESLVTQTYSEIEILLVNDGSKDNCHLIMEEYAKKDSRIVCLYKQNGGLSDARNYGLKYATGEFCMFVDSDDTIDSRTVELCVHSAKQYHSDIVVFDMKYIYPDREEFASGGNFECKSFKENRELIFINNSACNKMFRTSLFENVQFPKGMWYEDLATIPILISKAHKVSKVNEPLYFYLQREGSIAHTINEKIFDIYKAIHMIELYYSNHELDEEIKQLYIHHGLFLTTLRIKDSSNEIEKYLEMNIAYMDKYYPEWRSIKRFKGYSLKVQLIFTLLKKNCFKTVRRIYRK